MTTQKQIEANRRNARRSTGPRTAEGKARSSRNRRTHGLRALPLPDVQDEAYRRYLGMFAERRQPANREEAALVCEVALGWWERDIVDQAEHGIFLRLSEGKNDPDPATREAAWARFSRELGTLNRVGGAVSERLYRAEDQWYALLGVNLDEDEEEDEADGMECEDEMDAEFEFEQEEEEERRAELARHDTPAARAREAARARFLREAMRVYFGAVADASVGNGPSQPVVN